MTAHLIVILAGLIWIGACCALAEVGRLLGPAYNRTRTVHPGWRFVAWAGAAVCVVRGMTLMYPGQLVEVSRISVMAPAGALVVLGVSAALLHWVQSERNPPPWSVHVMRVAALIGRDGPVKFAAMAVPPAAVGDLPPPDEPKGERRSRLAILAGSAAILVALAIFLAVNAPGL